MEAYNQLRLETSRYSVLSSLYFPKKQKLPDETITSDLHAICASAETNFPKSEDTNLTISPCQFATVITCTKL